ncbi:hypothetical protein KKC97_08490, partial [bacterium]|nr:hypothetical protein [bacterium]
DIQEYIDNCEFVIADITYDRPNCYVEIGYALAKGKHVIGFYQKEYVDEKIRKSKRESRIPFDLNTYKFQEYPRGNVEILKERLEARIGAVRTMKSSRIP